MVSPSKKKKTEKKGRESLVNNIPLGNANQIDSKKPTKSSRKPLASKRVYLDLRSNSVLAKLEKDLKYLGARTEPFLDDDVDYFVTDRQSASSSTTATTRAANAHTSTTNPSPSPSPSPAGLLLHSPYALTPSPVLAAVGAASPGQLQLQTAAAAAATAFSPSGAGGGGNGCGGGFGGGRRPNSAATSYHHHVTRSRAEAMLDCVRAPHLAATATSSSAVHHNHNHNNHTTTVDPIEKARTLKVPIVQLQQFVRWIEKLLVESSSRSSSSSSSANRRVKLLNKEFIKLEECSSSSSPRNSSQGGGNSSISRRRRPEFRELSAWPVLRYEGSGGGPFESGALRVGGARGQTQQRQHARAAAAVSRRANHTTTTTTTVTSSKRNVAPADDAAAGPADRMTRKEAALSSSGGACGGGAGGYCEMCCLDYGDLTQHLTSAGHLKLAQDPGQFASLDTFIRDACLDTLITNGASAVTHCSVVLEYTNNNNNNNSRRVLRSSHQNRVGSAHAQSNGLSADQQQQQMGNRSSSGSAATTTTTASGNSVVAAAAAASNGHHVTRSTTANHRAAAVSAKPEVGSPVTNGGLVGSSSSLTVSPPVANHNHLTRLSVRTDLGAGGATGLLATPTLPPPPPSPAANDVAGDERLGPAVGGATTPRAGRSRTTSSSSAAAAAVSPRLLSGGGGGGACKQNSSRLAPVCGGGDDDNSSSGGGGVSSKHHLRSKKQLRLPHALQGTTAEDGGQGQGQGHATAVVKSVAQSQPQLPPLQPTRLKLRRSKLRRRKRLSVEEKLIEDNRSYYKVAAGLRLIPQHKLRLKEVEVLNSKLRSTGYYMSQRELELSRGGGGGATSDQHSGANSTATSAAAAAAASPSVANSTNNQTSQPQDGGAVGGKSGCGSGSERQKEPVVMRFKKVRKSELSLLSDEAENFMFGDSARHHQHHHHYHHHHHRSSDDEDADDDHYVVDDGVRGGSEMVGEDDEEEEEGGEDEEEEDVEEEEGDNTTLTTSSATTSRSCGGGPTTAAPLATADETSNSSTAHARGRRKRRTHAELFINDNLDYYKFDLSGGRLRGGGGVKMEVGVASDEGVGVASGLRRRSAATAVSEKVDGVVVKIKEEIKEEENTNEMEEEQDEGEEEEVVMNVGREEKEKEEEELWCKMTADEVRFAFESAPVHEAWYQTYRRQDEARETHLQMYHAYPTLRLPYEYRDKHRKRLLWAQTGGKSFPFRRRKKRGGLSSVLGPKRATSLVDDRPRKSPRCHASTLAILSTLKYRRRRISPGNTAAATTPRLSPATATTTQMSPATATPSSNQDSLVVGRMGGEKDSLTTSSPQVDSTCGDVIVAATTPSLLRRSNAVDYVTLAESLDNYFCEFYLSGGGDGCGGDRYASVMQKLRQLWVECHEGEVLEGDDGEEGGRCKDGAVGGVGAAGSSKRLPKTGGATATATAAAESADSVGSLTPAAVVSPSSASSCYDMCMDVDPCIWDEWGVAEDEHLGGGASLATPLCPPGPQEVDFLQLLAGYRQCNSMERALYGHIIHPRAIEALRRNVGGGGGGGLTADALRRGNVAGSSSATGAADHSCGSSDYGGSSTGELLGFTEDGRMLSSHRRKRKKRNMTGWPKDKPKKLQQQLKQQLTLTTTTQTLSGLGCRRSLQRVVEAEEAEDEDDVATAAAAGDVTTKVTRLSVSRAASLDSPRSGRVGAGAARRVLRGGKTGGGGEVTSPPKRRASSSAVAVGAVTSPVPLLQRQQRRRGARGGRVRGRAVSRGGWSSRRGAAR